MEIQPVVVSYISLDNPAEGMQKLMRELERQVKIYRVLDQIFKQPKIQINLF